MYCPRSTRTALVNFRINKCWRWKKLFRIAFWVFYLPLLLYIGIGIGKEKEGRTVQKQDEKKIILWYTNHSTRPFFYYEPLERLEGECGQKCIFTTNGSLVNVSHALAFDCWSLRDHGMFENFPPHRDEAQIYMYWSVESGINTRHLLTQTRTMFNWTVTFDQNSDYQYPYGEFTRKTPEEIQEYNFTREIQPILEKKKLNASVCWLVSHFPTDSRREDLVQILQQHIPVHIEGKLVDRPCPNNSWTCRKKMASHCKFYLAFENSLCKDYITEKFFEPLRLGMVPVVYGIGSYRSILPPGSYINVASFASMKALAHYLKYLDRTLEDYLQYFRWRKYYKYERKHVAQTNACAMCERLHREYGRKKSFVDIQQLLLASSCSSKSHQQIDVALQ